MKITKDLLRKVISESLKHINEKTDLEAYRGDTDLRGGVEINRLRGPKKGDVVVFQDVDYRTDTRNYYYGVVDSVEEMDRRNTTGGNMADVKVYLMAAQAKKGAKTGEMTEPVPVDPKIFNKETNELSVLRDKNFINKRINK